MLFIRYFEKIELAFNFNEYEGSFKSIEVFAYIGAALKGNEIVSMLLPSTPGKQRMDNSFLLTVVIILL